VLAHSQVVLLLLDVEVAILSDGLEDAAVGGGQFGLGAVAVFNLSNKYKHYCLLQLVFVDLGLDELFVLVEFVFDFLELFLFF
jgi:hypothetical protein